MSSIVSMLPAATEIVCALGLKDRLRAVSHDCSYPPDVQQLPRVTRCRFDPGSMTSREIDETVRSLLARGEPLYEVDRNVLRSVSPALIVTQRLCDVCAVAPGEVHRALAEVGGNATVLELGPQTLDDVLNDVRLVARAAGVPDRGEELYQRLVQRLNDLAARVPGKERPRVVVLEWLDPPYCCGHWIPELVQFAGGNEVLGVRGGDSHPISWDRVRQTDPDVIVVACCGYDVDRTYRDVQRPDILRELRTLRAFHEGRAWVADATGLFTCPGPRVVDTAELIWTILWDAPSAARNPAARRIEPDRVA